jgi:A/G-specific adenine glycosylase
VKLNATQIADFQRTVWDYYRAHARPMPWRDNPTPYFVLVSEVMLQQTQVPRVLIKFAEFTNRFPDFASLAAASFADVLSVWSGLGYNRRAKFLWEAAKAVSARGSLPQTREELVLLPGIGPNTAGAILAYAYNQPVLFIETNIRTVIIHHFFADHDNKVKDTDILAVLDQVTPDDNHREWYWALMDYGTHLKSVKSSHLHRAQSYKKQSKFEGSRRQIRGKVLRLLLEGGHTTNELAQIVTDDRLPDVLEALRQEGMIGLRAKHWHLTV